MSSQQVPEDLPAPPPQDHSTIQEKESPTPGYRWMTSFLVREPVAEYTGTDTWNALHIVSMDEMLLTVSRVSSVEHEQAVADIKILENDSILKPIEAHTSQGRRIVVTRAPHGPSLRAWRAGKKTVPAEMLVSLVRTIGGILSSLHAKGVGHFNIRPEKIFVEERDVGPCFVLGGWDSTTLMRQKDLIPIPVDPFYAPPEAAGLEKHSPGDDLGLWDWWSLGRVLEEMVAGQHVLGIIHSRDVSIRTTENTRHAEELLFNRSPGGYRAGAVEALPPADKRIEFLLRGLMATVKEARWRESEVSLWLDGQTPKEHYSLSPREHCFRWQDQAYTIPEAAEIFRKDEHWEHAADQLLNADQPGTLAAFIQTHGSDAIRGKLAEAVNLTSDEALREFPPGALREIATMIGLLELAGGKLIWRGRRIDGAALKENLSREDGSGQWLGTVWALTSSTVICLLDRLDPESGRVLTDVGKLANKALEKMLENAWLSQNDLPAISKIWQAACDHPSIRLAAREHLHSLYACSTIPEVQEIFGAEKPSPEMFVILAYMDSFPARFGLLTHEEWSKREYAKLYEKGFLESRILFWKNLQRALRLGPWWYGRIWWPLIAWGGFALAFSFIRPGPLMEVVALLPIVLAVFVRFLLAGSLRGTLSRWEPGSPPWKWNDDSVRCDREEAKFGAGYRSASDLRQTIHSINAAIAKLVALSPKPHQVPFPPVFRTLALAALSSWVVLGLLAVLCVWQFRVNPPSIEKFLIAWSLNANPEDTARKLAEEEAKKVKLVWNFRAPDIVKEVKPYEVRPATAAEIAEAQAIGRSLLSQYKQETISAPILVRFTTEERYGFVLYDGRRDRMASKNAYILVYDPIPRTWLELEGTRAFVQPR